MARYIITGAGFRGHVHLWDDTLTYSNDQRGTLTYINTTANQPIGSQNNWKYGKSVSVDLNTMVVGIPGASQAIVYEWESNSWVEKIVLTAGIHAEIADEFGYAVSVQDHRIVIGAPGANSNMGAAYLFERKNGQWRESIPFKIIPSDPALEISGRYGSSVSYMGQALVVGAPDAFGTSGNTDRWGAVYSYSWGAHNRNLSVLPKITLLSGQNGNKFGYSLSFNNENTLVVGTPYESVSYGSSYVNNGAVYIFQRTGGQANTWTQKTKIIPPTGETNMLFGFSVSMRENHVLIGAPGHEAIGSAFLYFGFDDSYTLRETFNVRQATDSTIVTGDFQGYSVGYNAEKQLISIGSPYNDGKGAVYNWSQTESGNWLPSLTSKLIANDGVSGDMFGSTLAQSSSHMIIGAPDIGISIGGTYYLLVG